MKLLVIGATGRTGALLVTKALDEGHEVTALVRNAKVDIDPRVQIVQGSVTDANAIANAATGHDAIISALGVRSISETPTLITDMVRAVIASSKISGVNRFVLLSAFGVGDSLAKASWIASALFRTMLKKVYADKANSEKLLIASDLVWTVEYPGALNDHAGKSYTATELDNVSKLPLVPATSRASVADFLLRSAVDGTFIRQIAVVTDKK
ncbi:SDR family oxidoreductase [Glutamicibacter mishrai]|uniref:NAD(P)-dependent oxidoreductase n=1 Tax=Glutamicibacter mishrai TaxID=1775880 RepID=UPI0020CBBDCD|nr:NAD(P)-binding oxidoreductase [Glutamicibacter mishrai]UTT38630.1 SDR family oxidoreductase [Glutamicibacter mishrai]